MSEEASHSEMLALKFEKHISGNPMEIIATYDFFQGQILLKATCLKTQRKSSMIMEIDVAAGIDVNNS